jgi:hypothetical protein
MFVVVVAVTFNVLAVLTTYGYDPHIENQFNSMRSVRQNAKSYFDVCVNGDGAWHKKFEAYSLLHRRFRDNWRANDSKFILFGSGGGLGNAIKGYPAMLLLAMASGRALINTQIGNEDIPLLAFRRVGTMLTMFGPNQSHLDWRPFPDLITDAEKIKNRSIASHYQSMHATMKNPLDTLQSFLYENRKNSKYIEFMPSYHLTHTMVIQAADFLRSTSMQYFSYCANNYLFVPYEETIKELIPYLKTLDGKKNIGLHLRGGDAHMLSHQHHLCANRTDALDKGLADDCWLKGINLKAGYWDRCGVAAKIDAIFMKLHDIETSNHAAFLASDNDAWRSTGKNISGVVITDGIPILSSNPSPDLQEENVNKALRQILLDYFLLSYTDTFYYSCGTFSDVVVARRLLGGQPVTNFLK